MIWRKRSPANRALHNLLWEDQLAEFNNRPRVYKTRAHHPQSRRSPTNQRIRSLPSPRSAQDLISLWAPSKWTNTWRVQPRKCRWAKRWAPPHGKRWRTLRPSPQLSRRMSIPRLITPVSTLGHPCKTTGTLISLIQKYLAFKLRIVRMVLQRSWSRAGWTRASSWTQTMLNWLRRLSLHTKLPLRQANKVSWMWYQSPCLSRMSWISAPTLIP